MGVLRQLKNPFVQQYLLEILFPLIGYFFFDWGVLIIGLYYLVDYLASIILFLKRATTVNSRGKNPVAIFYIVLVALGLFFIYGLISAGFIIVMSQVSAKTEAGIINQIGEVFISELWFLIPVVFVLYYFKDRFTFYMPRRYLNYDPKNYLLVQLYTGLIILFGLSVLAYGWIKFNWADIMVIILFLGGKIGFDLTLKKRLTNRSFIRKIN